MRKSPTLKNGAGLSFGLCLTPTTGAFDLDLGLRVDRVVHLRPHLPWGAEVSAAGAAPRSELEPKLLQGGGPGVFDASFFFRPHEAQAAMNGMQMLQRNEYG